MGPPPSHRPFRPIRFPLLLRHALAGGLAVVIFAAAYSRPLSMQQQLEENLLLAQTKESTALSGSTPHSKLSEGNRSSQPKFSVTLHLIGERHSGTNWMERHLRDCFGRQVEVLPHYNTHKHWFQYDEPGRRPEKSAVVVALFRNPLSWTNAMRLQPHHAPNHYFLTWPDFVNKPWTMPRYGADVAFDGASAATVPANVTCRHGHGMQPHTLIPCRAVHNEFYGTHAYYELRNDGSGLPYATVLDLRVAKIRNFLNVQHHGDVKHFVALRYEDVFRNGTQLLLQELQHHLNASIACQPVKGTLKSKVRLKLDYQAYMETHVDWETEALLGYTPKFRWWDL